MEFQNPGHSADVLSELRKQQETSEFCDVTLEVDNGEVIRAHRAVLAANSAYFKALFGSCLVDTQVAQYKIPECSLGNVEEIIHYMYSGHIEINPGNVQDILRVADFLCVSKLKQYCSEMLRENITDENCLYIKFLADLYNLDEVRTQVNDYVTPRLAHIMAKADIVELPVQFIKAVLADPVLSRVREPLLADMVLKWVQFEPDARTPFWGELFSLLEIDYLPLPYASTTLMRYEFLRSSLPPEVMARLQRLLDTEVQSHKDVIFCRSRSVQPGGEVQLLCYNTIESSWLLLKAPAGRCHCWDGVESMIQHQGYLYVLVSEKIDIYGYMHHTPERKQLLRADFKQKTWEELAGPTSLKGQCRLISHVDGLYAIDLCGHTEEFDAGSGTWVVATRAGFDESPGATLYILPMPADRCIYLLRGFSTGCALSYAQTSFSLHVFDTVTHSWDFLSEIDSGDLDLADHERFHGYTVTPGKIVLRNEIGHQRVSFDLENRNWSSRVCGTVLPTHYVEVWGSAAQLDRVYLVGQCLDKSSFFLMYDHDRRRLKQVSSPPCTPSGLLCPMRVSVDALQAMTVSLSHDQ